MLRSFLLYSKAIFGPVALRPLHSYIHMYGKGGCWRGKLAVEPQTQTSAHPATRPGPVLEMSRWSLRFHSALNFWYLLKYNTVQVFFFFFFLWLHWVFIAVHGLSLVVASGGYSSLQCAGFSLQWLLLLRSTGSRYAGFSSCGSRALERRLSSCGARA